MIHMGNAARYAVPLALLGSVPALSFALLKQQGGGGVTLAPVWLRVVRAAAAAPLFLSGAGHFLATAAYASIIPPAFPHREGLVVASGVCEIAGAAGLLLKPTRRAAAVALTVLMIAVFPANIHVAGQRSHGIAMPEVPVRTAMQAAYILLILVAGFGKAAGFGTAAGRGSGKRT